MRKILILLVAFCFMSTYCLADLIYLKNGSVIDAEIVEDGPDSIKINDGRTIKTISKKDVERMADNDQKLLLDHVKLKVPTDEELKRAEFAAYNAIAEMKFQNAEMKREIEQIKTIMGIELGIIVAGLVQRQL